VSARWRVPRHNQDGPRCPAEDTFSNGTLPKALPPAPPVGAEHDEVGLARIGMEHDRPRRIAVLLDGPHRNAYALCPLSQAGQQFETVALVP